MMLTEQIIRLLHKNYFIINRSYPIATSTQRCNYRTFSPIIRKIIDYYLLIIDEWYI